ncbi:MAG: HsdR family type I site-specific deoxyribonuclease [Lachnospiraceae bacterium]|nr:HsdR family type I site-specific deoxyribonuclease [Lachnospiraceae bacterium]
MTFNSELAFEKEVIEHLQRRGWSTEVLKYKTESELLDNWANILFQNNKGIERLNGCPLTDGEKKQLLEQINKLKTPFNLNKFINGKTMIIKRDNPDDTLHFGKEVSLDIYDREQIAGGKSVYQIVEQPVFPGKKPLVSDRRGDLMLLINGMPVIHIELKKSSIPVSHATEQIKKYAADNVFTGLFSMIQVFVAMTPEETVYFANPGQGPFNDKYFFHWADFNNKEYKDWQMIIEHLLSIPMAHKLIGFYTVPDSGDGILKVLRSYQYYAVEAISNRVTKAQWTAKDKLGGYICHTTGSGKTLTSFKAAQLVAGSGKVDKAVFLVDRIELGTQSALEYNNFASDNEEVQETESTYVLIDKLKSNSPLDNLIVTSIQKMSNIQLDEGVNQRDIEKIGRKKIAFIIDECHRSTFGEMLASIKETFPTALYFGFTGTPIYEENQKKMNTTNTVFGDELHRYSIADGINDGNVLGFDPYKVCTFSDMELRKSVAINQAKAKDEDDALNNPKKSAVYYHFINDVPMAGYDDDLGNRVLGIEDYIPSTQYERRDDKSIETQHQYKVVENILKNWKTCSVNSKFSAIFATSSIEEACQYYRLFKVMMGKNGLPTLNITGVFDETIGNNSSAIPKEEALVEILTDYDTKFNQKYSIPTYAKFKKDVALRMAHKERYLGIEKTPEKVLNLVIVVDQMLTGYDSKWINTLYLDKRIKYEAIVQAFSRTNRIFGKDKQHGTIKYYRYPHTMERNIKEAFELYSGSKMFGVFVDKLEKNLITINALFTRIKEIFNAANVNDFKTLPGSKEANMEFALNFARMCKFIEAAKIQGFVWSRDEYFFDNVGKKTSVKMLFDENTFLILAQRYKELFIHGHGPSVPDVPYDIDSTAIEIDTGKIDANYMNSNFVKYVKAIQEDGPDAAEALNILEELHKTFATLSQEDQSFADMIITDIQGGKLFVESGKTFKDYINDYKIRKKNDEMHRFATLIGIDENLLKVIMKSRPTSSNIGEFGNFDRLIATLDLDVAKVFFDAKEGRNIPKPLVKIKAYNLIRDYILQGGFEV